MNDLVTESLAGQPLLSFLTFMPIIGAIGIALRQMMAKRGAGGEIGAAEQAQIDKVARDIAKLFTVGAFGVSLYIFIALYDRTAAGYQLVETAWGSEEQGLNGSRAFVEDHPEIIEKTHAVFNQDNGTGYASPRSACKAFWTPAKTSLTGSPGYQEKSRRISKSTSRECRGEAAVTTLPSSPPAHRPLALVP